MPDQVDVLAQVARLEGELLRIQRELDELRALAGGPVRGARVPRHTQTFEPILGAVQPDSAGVPRRESRAQSEARITRPERPEPSVPVHSKTMPATKSDRRVHISARTGITEFPPGGDAQAGARAAAQPDAPVSGRVSTGTRSTLTDPQAGRYEYYDEASPTRTDAKGSRRR